MAILLVMSSCKTGIITEKLKKGNAMFEKYDFNKWEEDNKEYKGKGEYPDTYYFKDGREVDYSNNAIGILPAKPLFYVENKEFYENGFIKQKGKYFGRFNANSYGIKIGIWYEFDEKGNLIKETDEDKKFGAFSYNEVLTFLDKEEQISIHNGRNRENLEIDYFFSKDSNQKLWRVEIKIGKPSQELTPPGEVGERISQKIKVYYLDGNTGEVIPRKELLKYKEIIPQFDKIYPDLK